MFNSFHGHLNEFIGKTVRIFINGGEGFAGCVLGVRRDFIEVLAIRDGKINLKTPNAIIAIPIEKITAINYYTKGNTDCNEDEQTIPVALFLAVLIIFCFLHN